MKIITKILSLVLALILVFSLAACGSKSASSDSIVGNWKCTVNFDKVIDEMKKAGSVDDSTVELVSQCFKGLTMSLALDLKEDGSFQLGTDEKDMKSLAEELEARLPDIILDFAASLGGMTREELDEQLAAQGMTTEDVLAQFGGSLSADSLLESMAVDGAKGTYTYKDGKLALTSDGETVTYTVTLSGNELKITGVESGDDTLPEGLMPLVFTR